MLNSLLFKFYNIHNFLFPILEETLELSDNHRTFVHVIEMMPCGNLFQRYAWCGNGCKPADRESIFRAFIAKAVFNIVQTSDLIVRLKTDTTLRSLCGYDSVSEIPSESTFSRAFGDFARDGLASKVHATLIDATVKDKLFGHASIDATAIEAREKATPKPKQEPRAKGKRGRRKTGEPVPPRELKRIDLQPQRSLEENILDLPAQCDVGVKRNSKGHTTHWKGYKLHISVLDGDIPVAAVLTSASLHDSQVAIPLMQMTSERVDRLYDLMDAAYDADAIHDFCFSQGHVPIIDGNTRRGEKTLFTPDQKARYAQRSSVERVNSAIKDSYGARFVRVRGAAKVMTHLMFGIIALTATQIVRMLA